MRDVGFLDPRPGPACDGAMNGAIFDAWPSKCSMDSGYSFWVIQAPPRADQVPAICRSSSCKAIVDVIRKFAPTECVMRDGFYAYQDILNPILAQCGSGPGPTLPPPTTPPPTTAPAPWTFTPASTGESPVDGSWNIPTSAPVFRYTSPPSSASTSTFSSSDDSTPPYGVIFGCVVGAIFLFAIFLWVRQQRKRDPDVQRFQHLEYGDEGAFDSVLPSAPTPSASNAVYTAMQVAYPAQPETVETSIPPVMGMSKAVSHHEIPKNNKNRSSLDASSQMPLLHDEQITAVRVPFDKLSIGERLKSGGFGEVYKGTYKQELVAIKRMLPNHRNDTRLINKFLGEVKLMASLEHERIVRFIGVAWETPNDICVLSEYMDGGDLRSMLKRLDSQKKPIGFDRPKLQIALHVAHALTYMHSLQPVVLHRDLKSSNILLSQDMDAKITDFGVSRERADATMTRGVGTSLWMAPEIMMGGRYDEKADMFSFGVVLSELDSNKLPYETQVDLNDGRGDLMHSVSEGRLTVEFSYDSDPEIVSLGRDCVAVDPQHRPSAAEALHRIHQVLRQYDGY